MSPARRRGLLAGTVLATASLPVLSAAAGAILCHLVRVPIPPMPGLLWYWPEVALRWWGDVRIMRPLEISGAVPLAAAAGAATLMAIASHRRTQALRPSQPGEAVPPPLRAASAVHDTASWLAMADARAAFADQRKPWGNLILGEAYRVDEERLASRAYDPADRTSWGQGGRAPLLVSSCASGPTHGMIFAGSGGSKTTGFFVPTLLPEFGWRGPAVVFDPAGQVGPMTGRLRAEAGQNVVTLRPRDNNPDRPAPDSIDLLGWIKPSDPMAELHVESLLNTLCGDISVEAKGENGPFATGARELQTCVLADMLWDPALPPGRRTLREWRARMVTPEAEMKGRLEGIARATSSPLAQQLAGSLAETHARTFSGIYRGAVTKCAWLSIDVLADLVSGTSGQSFSPGDVNTNNMTVFVELSEDLNETRPEVCRSIIGSIVKAIYLQGGSAPTRTLLALDEARFLGRLEALTNVRDSGRKHGITMVTAWPNVGEVERIWGKESLPAWFGSSSWRMFAAIDDDRTAKLVSGDLGTYTALVRTEGTTRSSGAGGGGSRGRNEGTALISVPLMTPAQLMRMRRDEMILFSQDNAPLRTGRSIYFRRPEMKALVDRDRFRTAAE